MLCGPWSKNIYSIYIVNIQTLNLVRTIYAYYLKNLNKTRPSKPPKTPTRLIHDLFRTETVKTEPLAPSSNTKHIINNNIFSKSYLLIYNFFINQTCYIYLYRLSSVPTHILILTCNRNYFWSECYYHARAGSKKKGLTNFF